MVFICRPYGLTHKKFLSTMQKKKKKGKQLLKLSEGLAISGHNCISIHEQWRIRNWNNNSIYNSIEKAYNSWDKCNNIYASFIYIKLCNTAKDDLSKWDILFVDDTQYCFKMLNLPKLIYRFNTVSIKIPAGLFYLGRI